jgi:hypothetical protein
VVEGWAARNDPLARLPWPAAYPYETKQLMAARQRVAEAIEALEDGAPFIAKEPLSKVVVAGGAEVGAALNKLGRVSGVRGRLERAVITPSGAPVYVDYAHTPDALEAAVAALRPHTANRLILLFGCGGDRDRGKRPEMGAIAVRDADLVIVTDDNPRTEDAAAIRAAVLAGMGAMPGARAIGVAQSALEIGMKYAEDRKQFGKSLVEFPRIVSKLAMMAVEIMVARQLTYFSAWQKDNDKRCDLEAGMAKLLGARVAWSSADNALQIHGGNGFALEYQISRILCDARILNIFEGAAEIQAQVIARRLLD